MQYLTKMPRYCLAFAVFIGCEPDFVGLTGGFLKFGNNFFVFRIDLVGDIKSVFVDFGIFANVPNGG